MISVSRIEIRKKEIENCAKINLVIGPNNCGKTVFLNELYQVLTDVIIPNEIKWINDLTIHYEKLADFIRKLLPNAWNSSSEQVISLRDAGYRFWRSRQDLWNQVVFEECRRLNEKIGEYVISHVQSNSGLKQLLKFISFITVARERCNDRLQRHFSVNIQNLFSDSSDNPVSYLCKNRESLSRISENIQSVFGIKVGFDNLQQGEKSLRILPETEIPGATNTEETAKLWVERSPLVASQGDGIGAYVRLALSLLGPYQSIVLIDEPEAFLHPPQCRAIGNLVADLAVSENKQVFIATHNSDILRGILNSNMSFIKIFYLSRRADVFSYSSIDALDIQQVLESKSTLINEKILSSFFYRKTILCESENDRTFYEHAAARFDWESFQDVNFIGLNGKDQVFSIFKKLKQLGLNVGCIVDIDFLIDGQVPDGPANQQIKDILSSCRGMLNKAISRKKTSRLEIKKLGIHYFEKEVPSIVADLVSLISALSKIGIYVVREGELESWTRDEIRTQWDLQKSLDIINNRENELLKCFLKSVLRYW